MLNVMVHIVTTGLQGVNLRKHVTKGTCPLSEMHISVESFAVGMREHLWQLSRACTRNTALQAFDELMRRSLRNAYSY